MIFVNFEIFEFTSIIAAFDFASKNSPSNVTTLNPDFESRCAALRDFTRIILPNKNVRSDENFESHFT